jgi:hypothetical protein
MLNLRNCKLTLMKTQALIIATLLLANALPATAEEQADDLDQPAPDAKDNSARFLPLPIIITEPAIGEGLAAALIYFHAEPKGDVPALASAQTLNRSDRQQAPPPTATGLFAAYTNNDTRAIGIGHSRTFRDDRYRLIAAYADATVNTTFYFADLPFDFTLEGDLALAKLKRRIANSNMFIGLSTSYLNADVTFFKELPVPIPSLSFKDIGIALSVVYDSQDDGMMPTTGQLLEFESWNYDAVLGGAFDYWKGKLKLNSFHTFGKKFVLGLRFEASAVDGDNPFYATPYVSLRGIPALRYQGKLAGVVETEGRYRLARRWSVLAFSGAGFTDNKRPANKTDDDIRAFGFGVRYLALPTKNIWVGLDLARGPEEDAFYIQLAHPW